MTRSDYLGGEIDLSVPAPALLIFLLLISNAIAIILSPVYFFYQKDLYANPT